MQGLTAVVQNESSCLYWTPLSAAFSSVFWGFSVSQNVIISFAVYPCKFLYTLISSLLSQTRQRRIQNKWLYQGVILYPEYLFTVLHSPFKCLIDIVSTLEILYNETGDGTIFLKNKPLFFILINAFSFCIFDPTYLMTLFLYCFWRNSLSEMYLIYLCLCVIFIHWMGINAVK